MQIAMGESPIHPAALPLDGLMAECTMAFTRRSGPGGQHRNKVATAVVLVHRPTGVRAEANERRSQAENRKVALIRMRRKLAIEFRRPSNPAAVPSPLWSSRCHSGRIDASARHPDFPALLAESLDVLADRGMDIRLAAQALQCSPSQLVKFLKREPQALDVLNQFRREKGLRTYV